MYRPDAKLNLSVITPRIKKDYIHTALHNMGAHPGSQ